MASEGVSVCCRVRSHPLDLFRSTLDEYELDVWTEFEAKLPDLFVTEASICKVEVVEIIPLSTQQVVSGDGDESTDEGNVVEWASTIDELNLILDVCNSISKVAPTFTDYRVSMIYSEIYRPVLRAYCERPLQQEERISD